MRASLGRILFPARNAETLAWRAAVVSDGGSVSNQRLLQVDKHISLLKAASIWGKIDRRWLFAAENSQSALRDIKAAAAATLVNAPTFVADQGYAGNGTTSYINSGFTPSTAGGAMTQNSAHVSVRSRTSLAAGNSNRPFGRVAAATANIFIISRIAGDSLQAEMNDTSATSAGAIPNTTTLGHFLVNRSASNARQYYRDGSSLGTDATASTALMDQAIAFCADPASPQFTTMQIACGSIGGSLSSGDVTALYNAELVYMQAVGAA